MTWKLLLETFTRCLVVAVGVALAAAIGYQVATFAYDWWTKEN